MAERDRRGSERKVRQERGELKSEQEVAGPKLILSDYYANVFEMEPRAQERLNDLYDYWMQFVDDTTCYPIDCVFTAEELDTIDRYRVDFEGFVAEQEAAWLRDGGITDDTWAAYKENLNSYGMDKLLEAYQSAYDRYAETRASRRTPPPPPRRERRVNGTPTFDFTKSVSPFLQMASALRGAGLWGIRLTCITTSRPESEGISYAAPSNQIADRPRI